MDTDSKVVLPLIPVSVAVRGGHRECLELLIKAGADVNTTKKDGETALTAAAKGGNDELVELLIKEGANVNTVDKYGSTVLTMAAINGQTSCVINSSRS